LPVVGQATQAGDSWNDGNYGQSALHEVTGFLELALFAETKALAVYESISGYFTK